MTSEWKDPLMRTTATVRHGDAMTVFDDERRLQWTRPDLVRWVPTSVWPNAAEANEVRLHLALGHPLLVILSSPRTIVSLLSEELTAAAPTVVARVEGSLEEPIRVHIPALDWLPEDLRRPGLEFLDASARLAAQLPRPLLAPLMLSPPDSAPVHVRFAYRCSSLSIDAHLEAVVEHVFGRRESDPLAAHG